MNVFHFVVLEWYYCRNQMVECTSWIHSRLLQLQETQPIQTLRFFIQECKAREQTLVNLGQNHFYFS